MTTAVPFFFAFAVMAVLVIVYHFMKQSGEVADIKDKASSIKGSVQDSIDRAKDAVDGAINKLPRI